MALLTYTNMVLRSRNYVPRPSRCKYIGIYIGEMTKAQICKREPASKHTQENSHIRHYQYHVIFRPTYMTAAARR